MRTFFGVSIAVAAVALLAVFGVAVALFSRGLSQERGRAGESMISLALFCAEQTERMLAGGAGADDVGSWLGRYAAAGGFERIVIADSTGIVMYSSGALIERGDDLASYLVDDSLFRHAAAFGEPAFTRVVRIENEAFMSLYYPCRVGGEAAVAVLESNRSYLRALERFRANVVWVFASVMILLAAMFVTLTTVARQARAAMEVSRRNERLAFLGRTAAELAHELKNPLAIIKSSADVLRARCDPERTLQAFDFLSEEIMRLSRLIGDILSFSRERPLAPVEFSPRAIIDSMRHRATAAWPGVIVENAVPPDVLLTGDTDAFVQIGDNLLRNAAAATNGNGRVSIGFERRGRDGCLLFSDSGPGIPSSMADRVFEPFVSGSKSGTGLGLAIVRTLCERNGWRISARNNSAGGACFEIAVSENLWRQS